MRVSGLSDWIAIVCLVSFANAIWAWALSVCLTSERDLQRRLFWVLFMGLTHVLGALVYLAARALRVRAAAARAFANEDTAVD